MTTESTGQGHQALQRRVEDLQGELRDAIRHLLAWDARQQQLRYQIADARARMGLLEEQGTAAPADTAAGEWGSQQPVTPEDLLGGAAAHVVGHRQRGGVGEGQRDTDPDDISSMAQTDAVLRVLAESEEPLTPTEVAQRLTERGRPTNPRNVSATLTRLRSRGLAVTRERGQWTPTGTS